MCATFFYNSQLHLLSILYTLKINLKKIKMRIINLFSRARKHLRNAKKQV